MGVSHQSVSKPYQGEHRSTTQSKAFGAHAAVVADASHAVHHGVHAVHHAPPYHAPVKAGYAAADLAEVSPYQFTYAVADDYSKAAFNQEENNDGNGVVAGSYSVALPDGRTQTVTYHANDYDGYVAEVTYSGEAQYPAAPAGGYHAAPAPAYHA